ncbi:MAG: hypothetical protein KAH08_04645, partial [Methylococcales bacterium]|nr:hypothetical protein [Methylococcales bacterium]
MKLSAILQGVLLSVGFSVLVYAEDVPLLLKKIEQAVPTTAQISEVKAKLQSKKKVELREDITLA